MTTFRNIGKFLKHSKKELSFMNDSILIHIYDGKNRFLIGVMCNDIEKYICKFTILDHNGTVVVMPQKNDMDILDRELIIDIDTDIESEVFRQTCYSVSPAFGELIFTIVNLMMF